MELTPTTVHVMPEGDVIEHLDSKDCECSPKIVPGAIGDDTIYLHRRVSVESH